MAATARQIPIGEADLAGDGGGAYASLEVPGDYEAVLKDVSDYDYRAKGKSYGWIFTYSVETPMGGSVDFLVHLSFGENARWKLTETLLAHGEDLSVGLNTVDPNGLIGDVVGAHIDFQKDGDGQPGKYREIVKVFSLANEPEAEFGVDEQAPLPAVTAVGIADSYDPERDGPKFGEEETAPAII